MQYPLMSTNLQVSLAKTLKGMASSSIHLFCPGCTIATKFKVSLHHMKCNFFRSFNSVLTFFVLLADRTNGRAIATLLRLSSVCRL